MQIEKQMTNRSYREVVMFSVAGVSKKPLRNICGRIFIVMLASFSFSCMEQKPVQRIEELQALKGKSAQEVLHVLGNPKVIDSSSVASERIWGYYQVMIRSEVDAKPRQRTVLVVFRKRDAEFFVDDVRIP